MNPPRNADRVVQVAPLLRLRGLGIPAYDYRVPEEWEDTPPVGEVVRAPFGRRRVTGVVVEHGPSGEVPAAQIAPLVGRTSEVLPAQQLELARHLSTTYLSPLGACLRTVVPPYLLAGSPDVGARRVAWVRPSGTVGASLTGRQEQVLGQIPPEGGTVAELVQRLATSRAVISGLVEKGWLCREERPATPPPESAGPQWEEPPAEYGEEGAGRSAGEGTGTADPLGSGEIDLTEEQAEAVSRLRELWEAGQFAHAVLWGVTGSGKTEVYLRVAQEVLAAGRGVLLLVPEIALTPQTAARVRARFGGLAAVLHSALAAGVRADEYRRVASGQARLVVGARSAVTAPVRDLGLIIIDEAHEGSYKQEDEPRYDARSVARHRMELAGGLLVEGSATPRLESLVQGRPVIRLHARPAGAQLPEVEVVDLRRQGGEGILAPVVRKAIRATMERGDQAVVLLNRRGYAGYLQCPACGEVVMCDRCEVTLTYFRGHRELRCQHCGRRRDVPPTCPACGEAALERRSPGTERLGEELSHLVPRDGLFRLDSDVVTSSGRVEDILTRFANTRPAVLVGTQMVAKGHDFPGVTTVVVADADTGLYLPDFRASERTFQLLAQVAGRAGRGREPGRVYVQTWNPDAACIRMALDHRGEAFYREESALRRRLGYPPYRRLVRLVVSGSDEERVGQGARYLAQRLEAHLPPGCLRGPARLPRLRNRARHHLVLGLRREDPGFEVVRRAIQRFGPAYRRRGVDLMVDVEPQSFL